MNNSVINKFLLAIVFTLLPVLLHAQNLEIHIINIHQGSSILIKGPNGKLLLFDGGKVGAGTRELVPYLQSIGITTADALDHMIVSHKDGDHFGGLRSVIEAGYDVLEVYDNGSSKALASYDIFIEMVENLTTAASINSMSLGHLIELGSGARAICVVVGGHVIGGIEVSSAQNRENDKCIGLLIQYGDFDFLACGDLGGGEFAADRNCTGRKTGQSNVETPLANALINENFLGAFGVEVLHINHHGSESSTNKDYMNMLTPAVAAISVGSNGYGHPRKDVVENVLLAGASCITAAPALVLQTDEGDIGRSTATDRGFVVGDIIITTDGISSYTVSATGQVAQGINNELTAAQLPRTFGFDEPASVVLPGTGGMVSEIGIRMERNRSWKKGFCTVKVAQGNNPVNGAAVSVTWSGSYVGLDQKTTDPNGVVVFESRSKRDANWTFTVRIDNITKDGLNWNKANSATTATIAK